MLPCQGAASPGRHGCVPCRAHGRHKNGRGGEYLGKKVMESSLMLKGPFLLHQPLVNPAHDMG